MAELLLERGELDESEALLQQALDLDFRGGGGGDLGTGGRGEGTASAGLMHTLARVLAAQGKAAQSETW